MQQPGQSATSASSASFVGMLAALAAPAQKRPAAWDDDDLAEDVATLSYERALRAHARYKAPDDDDRALTQPSHQGPVRIDEALPAEENPVAPHSAAQPATTPPANAPRSRLESEFALEMALERDRNLKCASITIRLSKAECVQLRKRAAEAGLTVSAYLRSCTFEAESLRALVKDTLAQLRANPSKGGHPASAPVRRSWPRWLASLWPHTRTSRHTAQA